MSEIISDLLSDTHTVSDLTPPNGPVQSRTPKPHPRTKNNNRPSGKGNPKTLGHRGPYIKAPIPKSLTTYALFAHYAIYVSLRKFSDNVDIVHQVLISRDKKLEDIISLSTLRYAALVVAYARVFSVRVLEGVAFPTAISKTLVELANYLHLPEFLASAIESVGVVSHDDRSYIPWVPVTTNRYKIFFGPLFRAYSALTGVLTDDVEQVLDPQLLLGFQTALVRGLKSGVAFRKVDLVKSAGHESFMVCLETCKGNRVRGMTPWVLVESVAQQGALWGWRKPSDFRPNRGDTHTLHNGFVTKEFEHQLHLVELCSSSFK